MKYYGVLSLSLFLFAASAFADDWSQWLGDKRDGVWREKDVVSEFPQQGLTKMWEVPVAKGYSGPAVSNNMIFVSDFVTEEQSKEHDIVGTDSATNGKERIRAYDLDGKLLWSHEYPESYTIAYANGPRATPTVHEGLVYHLGAQGKLVALNIIDGKVAWSVDLVKKYNTKSPMWGFSHHPLVHKDKLHVVAGGDGSIAVALDKNTGEEKWRALTNSKPDEKQGYSPPTIIEHKGKTQLLQWHGEALESLNPDTGESNWSCPFGPSYSMAVATPVKHNDLLYISAITNRALLLKLNGDKQPETEWSSEHAKKAVYTTNSTPVIEDGVIYGVDSLKGMLVAVDLKTGERLWTSLIPTTGGRRKTYATAFLVKNGDHFYIYNENGELITANLSRDGYVEISRTKLIEPTSTAFGRKVAWSHPAFAKKSIILRNDEKLVRYDLDKKNYETAQRATAKPSFSKTVLGNITGFFAKKKQIKLEDAAGHIEFMTKMGQKTLANYLKEHPEKKKSYTKNDLWSALKDKAELARTWEAINYLWSFPDGYYKQNENSKTKDFQYSNEFVDQVTKDYTDIKNKFEHINKDQSLSSEERKAKLWKLFGSLAALEYYFYNSSEVEIDLHEPIEHNSTLKMRDPASKKTLGDYFEPFEDSEKAISAIRDIASLEKRLISEIGDYETVKGLLPRFWSYHWEFHDLLLEENEK